ncbi:MAG TPA: helix-turn-helix transcriptional regulator [Flavisolibacter sp.]|jgi:transcriptional regulator with XRE-family HTH domain|nr:helix-turn-helix transcriptional regulator [Flavisolibacter sp.]
MSERAIHHGRAIKRIREIQGIKQEALALEMGDEWNQKKISLLESKEVVDDALLGEVAKALKVSPEAIKNFDEQAAINIIGNSYHDHAYSNVNYQCTINPLERWLEALEENKKLYERLLQAEKEKNALLEKLLKQRK